MKQPISMWSVLLAAVLLSLACAAPSLTVSDTPVPTARPTRTLRPTFTPTPTETPSPTHTSTPTATNTPLPPTETPTPLPTDTPLPPTATATRRPPPPPTNTSPPPPPAATATPAEEFTGREIDVLGQYKCSVPQGFYVAVVDRSGKPLPGYWVHVGTDGLWGDYTRQTTNNFKTLGSFNYNAEYQRGPSKYYVTVFRNRPEDNSFNIANAISNEVTARIDDKDDATCDGSNTNGRKLVVAVVFVYNR